MFYQAVKLIFPRLVRLYFRFEVRNLKYIEQLPEGVPVIYCFNHRSHLDTFLFASALVYPYGNRTACGLMTDGNVMEKNKFLYLLKYLGAYPIYAQNPSPALKYTLHLLNNNLAILIAPQGKRIPSTPLDDLHDLIEQAKSGIGRIVLKTNGRIPVVPVYIHGSYETLAFGKYIPKMKSFISVSICKPLMFTEIYREMGWNESDPMFFNKAKEISRSIMGSIREQMLVEEQYFFQILRERIRQPLEEFKLSYKSHPKAYRFFRNLLRYSPKELEMWLGNQE
jgi:1-acyl-sn-glycerol-3-phosphate acyltransferase